MSEKIKEQIREDEEDEGINILDYLIVLAKRKKLIISITLSVAIILIIITLSSKITFYEANTTILPPQSKQPSFASQFINRLGLGSSGGSTGGTHWNQRLLVELIYSKTVTNRLIERFNLKEYYNVEENNANLSNLFWENVYIEPSFGKTRGFKIIRGQNSPLISISVTDKNSERAAEIANAIVEELKIFIKDLAISEASQKSLFLKEHLRQANEALIKSEDDFKELQEKTGILEVKTQTGIVIEKIANLQAQIITQEVQLQVMKSYSTTNNPDVQKVEATIKGLKKELAKLKTTESNGKGLLISTGTIPAIGLEYKRLFRQLKFNEALYEIMVKQYEAAKIDEAKDATIIQVIDKAVPPTKPSQMRTWGRKKSLGLTFLAFFFSCFLAFVLEFHERSSKNSENAERMATLKSYLSFRRNK